MNSDFIVTAAHQQRERELTERLERRRVAAERETAELPGGRLELIARLARESRKRRGVTGDVTPAGC